MMSLHQTQGESWAPGPPRWDTRGGRLRTINALNDAAGALHRTNAGVLHQQRFPLIQLLSSSRGPVTAADAGDDVRHRGR